MDSFMDKLAQKFNAQDMIKANAQAEAAEMERLQKQVEQYESCLNEMQKLTQQNMEAMNHIRQLVESMDESGRMLDSSIASMSQIENPASKIDSLVESGMAKFRELEASRMSTEELEEKMAGQFRSHIEEMKALLDEQQKLLDEKFQKTEEYLHRESVKVYRNVQAVVVEETAKQTQQITEEVIKSGAKIKSVNTMGMLTLIAVILGIVLQIVIHLNIF